MNPRVLRVFTATSIASALCSLGTASLAAPPMLKGEFAFSGTASCLSSVSTFDPVNLISTGSVALAVGTAQGVRTFNGDGTGTVVGTTVSVAANLNSPLPAQGDANTFQFSFTYSVGPDGTTTSAVVPGTYHGTVTAGPRAGQTFTIDNYPIETLAAAVDHKTLVLATAAAAMETQHYSIAGNRYRICTRSQTLVWRGV